ncbi:DoxX family membrane protein [Pedobacter hiemivivus]|uniref:DoxX family protein n=1 Tax=Pedobacter hiemivivus TaxID=2530454 RepID=A0A4R0NKJ2_9SPHI|nr:DoxX family membrane protein [Pedobacter hiemivivus]TCC99474.1 DoxX family protein [Pedobacter hiemivivus]
MENSFKVPQLLLRGALGITFLTPVLDRLGILGPIGTGNIEWGNWDNFINYTSTLMPYLSRPMVDVMGGIATFSEFTIAVLLIIGFKTKYAAIGSSLLTFTFILFMTTSVGIQKPINFGVFTASAASLLLSYIPIYKWSIDNLLHKSN